MRHLLHSLLVCSLCSSCLWAQGELRFSVNNEPKSLHPLRADVSAEATVLFLSGGVLIRFNRLTQKAEPELAASWKISPDHRTIAFRLRQGVSFSDGTPFTSADVAFTLQAITDPAMHSALADSFSGGLKTVVTAPDAISVSFAEPHSNFEKLFDTLPILSAKSPLKEKAVLGPFAIDNYQPGVEILLKRNQHYWKKDAGGRQLPYLDAVRLFIQQNREIEYTRFRRHETHLINQMDATTFQRLVKESPAEAKDQGPTMDVDFLWFNQVPSAPIPDYKKEWFRSRNFRLAISQAINREDICRIVYLGYARPALGPFSSANRFWFNQNLKPQVFDPGAALALLQKEGFQLKNGELRDKAGHAVEFSIATNGSNKGRVRMATLIQQDLKTLGIRLNLVTIEIASLVERITRTYEYEAAVLGLINIDLDPNEQMNVWLSSSQDHAWNPHQKTPATPWEAEIDRLMRAQASALDPNKRKALFDKVQEIVREQLPYIYLVNRNSLSAISTSVKGVLPATLFPETFWNIDVLSLK
jgi:peptide/nickel transport system substrate-binding protein